MRNVNKPFYLPIPIVLIAVLVIGVSAAFAATDPELSIPTNIPTQPNSTVVVPVTFTDNGDPEPNNISSLAFSINYDENWLVFDQGAANAVVFNLPATYAGNCDFDASDADGELDCSVFAFGSNIDPIPDGVFLNIKLSTLDAQEGTVAPIAFSSDPAASFGNTDGQSVAGSVQDGSVLFGEGGWLSYLPFLSKKEALPPPPTPTPTPTGTEPTETPTHTPTPTPTKTPPACINVIIDSGFEDQNEAWVLNPTDYQAQYTNQRSNTGDWSVLTGIQDAGDNILSYSSVSQNVTIPNNIDSATLTFWHFSQSTETTQRNLPLYLQKYIFSLKPVFQDWQYAIAIDPTDPNNPIWLYSSINDNSRQWIEETIDMSEFEGKSFTLRFTTYNDGINGVSAMFVDDVTLEVCQ
jgi:hypothetical protein